MMVEITENQEYKSLNLSSRLTQTYNKSIEDYCTQLGNILESVTSEGRRSAKIFFAKDKDSTTHSNYDVKIDNKYQIFDNISKCNGIMEQLNKEGIKAEWKFAYKYYEKDNTGIILKYKLKKNENRKKCHIM